MSATELPESSQVPRSRLGQLPKYLLHPGQGAEWLTAQQKSAWWMPMLVLNITFLLTTLVSGIVQTHLASLGQATLPINWQWWSTDMQNNYLKAMQATQGPLFVFVIPMVIGLARLWLVWAVVAGLLHLLSTLLGGRGTMVSALNITAWAGLVFALRDVLRVIFILAAGHPILSAGLSGLAHTLFISKLLTEVDLFLVWHAILLIIGISKADNLPLKKSIPAAIAVLLIMLLISAGLGTMSASLGGLLGI